MRGMLLALGWLGGVALQLQQAELDRWPASVGLAAAGLVAAALAWSAWRRGGRRRIAAAIVLVGGAAAFAHGSTAARAAWRLADVLPASLEGIDLRVTGVVARLPQSGDDAVRFVFETEGAAWVAGAADAAASRDGPRLPERLAISWYRPRAGDATGEAASVPALHAGQRWQLTLRLRRPHGNLNPHGFDAELWWFEQGVRATGYVRSSPPPRLLAQRPLAHPVERLREAVRDAIVATVGPGDAAGVLAALAVGDQAAIDRAGWELFRTTGVAHLMSISGLHVTMLAALAAAVVGRAWRLVPRLLLRCPAPVAARAGGLVCAFGYALVAGFGVPVQRTVAMIAIVGVLQIAGLRWPQGAVLLAAAVGVTALDPWALLQPGFWLSFAAVALLWAGMSPAPGAAAAGWRSRVAQALGAQLLATVALAPLSLVFFRQVSLVGAAANAVAIPLVTLVVTPLALAGTLLPPLWKLAAVVVDALDAYLELLAGWPLALWTAAAAPPWAVASGVAGGLLLALGLPWRLRALGAAMLLPLAAPSVERPPPGRFELVAADIGQGNAVLVRTAGHLLVYDAGPRYGSETDAGDRVLLPLLRARGERRIDRLVLSHRDTDHVGGAASLLAGIEVADILASLAPGHPLMRTATPARRCAAGWRWQWDGVRFEVLHPPRGDDLERGAPNTHSCVLRVDGEVSSALLAGDIEAAQEAALVASGAPLAARVLLVPHHGSRTSSSPAFVAAVAPAIALVQAGYRNRFGHPAPAVVARYLERGVVPVQSDRCGAWSADADGRAVCERQRARRYWHDRAPAGP